MTFLIGTLSCCIAVASCFNCTCADLYLSHLFFHSFPDAKNLQDFNCTWPGHELREDERIGGFQSGLHWKAVEGWVQKAVPRTGAGTTWVRSVMPPVVFHDFFMFDETRVAALRCICRTSTIPMQDNWLTSCPRSKPKKRRRPGCLRLPFFFAQNLGGPDWTDPGWPRARLVDSPGSWSIQNQLLCRSATIWIKGRSWQKQKQMYWYDTFIDQPSCIDMYWYA